MRFSERQTPPPKYWQQFEDLCLDLFRQVWGDPHAKKNGRSGQRQAGTDVSGTPDTKPGETHGVQCKLKGAASKLTADELLEEVEKAKSFHPKLAKWTLAHSGRKDVELEQLAREITAQHREQGLFSVELLAWDDDIQSLLEQYPDVIARHYPEQAPASLAMAMVAAKLSQGNDDTPIDPTIAKCRSAASRANAAFLSDDAAASLIEVELQRVGKSDSETRVDREHVPKLVHDLKRVVLEAEPGAGKTTTLLQLARLLNNDEPGPVAIYLPLVELAVSRKDVLEELAGRSSFTGLSDGLKRLARDGHLVVLYDGWNELTTEQRDVARVSTEKHAREYPLSQAIVATRALSPSPFPSAERLALAPLTRAQQEAILVAQLGPRGSDLLTRARRVEGLRDVLETPLYVSALAAIGADGDLPRSKEAVLRRFIKKHRDKSEHQSHLDAVLRKQEDAYLEEIAWTMTSEGGTSLGDMAMRKCSSTAASALQKLQRISTPPEFSDVADVLVSHHLLTEHGEAGGERIFSFQHQQFQELYASVGVEKAFRSAAHDPSPESVAQRDQVLNAPAWEEPVLFAIDRLAAGSPEDKKAAAAAIERAVGIDPFLAAEMIRRAGDDVWKLVKDSVVTFAEAWHAADKSSLPVNFMLASGRPEFSDHIWRLLEAEDGLDRTYSKSHRLSPSVLGPDWKNRFSGIPEQSRRSLLWDLASAGQDGIDFVIGALPLETSTEVQTTIFDLVEYRATDAEVEAVLASATREMLDELASKNRLEGARSVLRPHLLAAKRDLASRLPLGSQRTRLLAELGEETPADINAEIEEVLTDERKDDYHWQASSLENLSKRYPDELAKAILAGTLRNTRVPYHAEAYVPPSLPTDQAELEKILRETPDIRGTRASIVCKLLDENSLTTILREAIEQYRQFRSAKGAERQTRWNSYKRAADILESADANKLAAIVVSLETSDSDGIRVVADVIRQWNSGDHDSPLFPLTDEHRAALSQRIDEWTASLLRDPNVDQDHLASLAGAIARIGEPALLDSVDALLAKNLALYRAAQEARTADVKAGKFSAMSPSSNEHAFRGVFDALPCETSRDILVKYLQDPDFGVQAAFALRRYAGTPQDEPGRFLGHFNVARIAAAKAGGEARRSKNLSPVASAVLDELDQTATDESPASLVRAVKLATAAVQMDYGDRFGSIASILAKPGRMSARLELFQLLLLRGHAVDPALLHQGLDEEIAEWAKYRRSGSDNDWWRFLRWLELFLFTSTPEAMLQRLGALPSGSYQEYNLRDLARACGHAGSVGLQPLRDLTALSPSLADGLDWAQAFADIGTLDALTALLDIIFAPGFAAKGHGLALRRTLALLLRRHPEGRAAVIERLKASTNRVAREVIAFSFGDWIDEPSFVAALDLVTSGKGDPLRGGLQSALRHLTTGFSMLNSEPEETGLRPLTNLKSQLFDISTSDDPRAAFAAELLREIIENRLEYGHPGAEPRHPNLASGKPIVQAAQDIWKV